MSQRDQALKIVAETLRPLLRGVAEVVSLQKGAVGVRFALSETEVALFSEQTEGSVPESEDGQDVSHAWSATHRFAAAVADPAVREFPLDWANPEPQIEGVVEKWADTKPCNLNLRVFSLSPAGRSDAFLYIDSVESLNLPEKFDGCVKPFVCELLEHALRLVAAEPLDHGLEREVAMLSQAFWSQLDDKFKEYDRKFKAILEDLSDPSSWLTKPFRTLSAPQIAGDTPPAWLSEIRGASQVTVVKPLFGSLQGKPVFLIKLQPRTAENKRDGAPYVAVAKLAKHKAVLDEHRGYLKVQQQFDDVSFALPPLAIAWRRNGEVPDDERYVVVTPRVSGEPLIGFTSSRWSFPWLLQDKRASTFRKILENLVQFTDAIAAPSESAGAAGFLHTPLLESHLGDKEKAKDRFKKTKEALAFLLYGRTHCPLLTFSVGGTDVELVNPLWIFKSSKPVPWSDPSAKPFLVSECCHGDFHAGNVLVTDDGDVTVLDYDYVGREKFRFADEATLETSFLLSVARAHEFRDAKRWAEVFPSLLAELANQSEPAATPSSVIPNRDSYELWELFQVIRQRVAEKRYFPQYRSLLCTALLRLAASYHREIKKPEDFHAGVFSTIILYVSFLLKGVVKIPDGAKRGSFDLFNHTLVGDVTDFAAVEKRSTLLRYQLRLRARKEWIEKRKSAQERDEAALKTLRESALIWRNGIAENYKRAADLQAESADAFRQRANGYVNFTESPAVIDEAVRSGDNGAPVEATLGDWTICGMSHVGKKNDKRNDDAFLIVQSGSYLLAAVADGTGDSIDGKRAATVALTALKFGFAETCDLQNAVLTANAAVQEDNVRNGLDGACCLACLAAKADSVKATTIGDTRFSLISVSDELTHARVDEINRHIIGGESLGDIITSSGNIVRELSIPEDVRVTTHEAIQRFVLCSDGAYVGKDGEAEDNKAIEDLLKSSTATVQKIARAVLDRALRAFDEGAKKADNVTVVVGFRNKS